MMTNSDHLVYMTKADQQELYGLRRQTEQAAARIHELEFELARYKRFHDGVCNTGTHVIVPVEPTLGWLNNVKYAAEFHGLSTKQVIDIYRTVIEAAQEKNDG
jgi:hypothetical protein